MGLFDFFGKNDDKARQQTKVEIVDKKRTFIILPKGKQIFMLVDFSGSMDIKDGELTGGESRLLYARKQTVALAQEASKIDPDGIDLITFSNDVQKFWNTTPDTVERAFRGGTRGTTATHLAISEAYKRHKEIGSQSTLVLIVTDGVPDSKSAVENLIVQIAREVGSPDVFKIAFLTVGKLNEATRNWLIELDDNLGSKTGGVDIVSVQPLCGAQFDAVSNAS